MKRTIVGIALGALMLCLLAGCSAGPDPTSADFEPAKDEVKVDQIDWTVENAVMDDKRRVAFSYTNNSKFTIVDLKITFSMKPDTTPESLRDAFESLKDSGWSDSQINEIANVTEDQLARLSVVGECALPVAPGETSQQDAMVLGMVFLGDMAQYELTEPSMMSIKYVAGEGKLYEETYDFKTSSYSLSKDVIDTAQWSDSEMAGALPNPEGELVVDVDDSGNRFTFETVGTTQEGFDAFVAACKEKGFTVDASESDTHYYADSADGAYELDVFYSPEYGQIRVYLDLAD